METAVERRSDQAITTASEDLDSAFACFLRMDVANGDASIDTIRCYRVEVAGWVRWCRDNGINPATATAADVKAHRQALIEARYKPSSIAHRLAVIRRFYQAAVSAGLRADNPAEGVKPPRDKRAVEDFGYLSEVELTLLFREVKGDSLKSLRDKAMLGLLGLMGLRTVEIERANVGDLQTRGDFTALLVRGKAHDRLVYLRPDVFAAIGMYLEVRGRANPDNEEAPIFTAEGNRSHGRISRRGIRQVVDFYLTRANLKRKGISDHALRHTAATLSYRYSHDLRAVQDLLGHADPKTTARYARVVDMARTNPTLAVPVAL